MPQGKGGIVEELSINKQNHQKQKLKKPGTFVKMTKKIERDDKNVQK